MKISKIVYKSSNNKDKALLECDIVFDDVLKVSGVRLYRGSRGYYLVFPSKQDVARGLMGESGIVPACLSPGRKKNYEEFYYPIDASFYATIRDTVVEGYDLVKNQSNKTYIPE